MRMVEILKPFTDKGVKFEVGHRYVQAEDSEQSLRTTYGDALGMSYPIDGVYRPYKGEDLNGKRILIFRTGGIGDILFLSPAIRYLKKKYPTCYIMAASACKQCLENVPEINELHDMPFDAKLMNSSDYQLFFQGILENSSEISKKTHAVDMFFSYFGIDSVQLPIEDKVPKLFFNKEEMNWLEQLLPNLGITKNHYVVGVQMETSAPLRNYPKEKLKAVIDALVAEPNVKVIVLGSDQHTILGQFYKGNNPNIIIATKYTVRQAMVLAQRYNLVISPDSFMVQVAGALGTPLIGLYGPFPSEVRMKYFKNSIGLDPSTVCTPCFKHDFRACIKGFPSPCFSLTTIEDILQAADFFRFKFTGQHFNFMGPLLKEPDISDIEKYMLSADKGLAFFPKYFKHPNIISVDTNPFTKADVTDLNQQFSRESYPFVIFFNEFNPKQITTYHNSKGMVRPGGHFIVYKEGAPEALFTDLKMDIGKSFILLLTKYKPETGTMIIVGKKAY